MSAHETQYVLENLGSVYELSHKIAGHFPDSEHYMTPVYELLVNAIEHGNLAIGFEAKTQLLRSGRWQQEIARRASMPEYAGRKVQVRLRQDAECCQLTITDEGRGFAWQSYLGRQSSGALPNGRGLMIALDAQFDDIYYNHAGNAVTCVVRRGA